MMSAELVALAVAVIGVIVGVAWWVRRGRKEGWTFQGGANLLDESSESAERHRNMIYRRCKSGMSVDTMMKNPEWDYLKKYTRADVEKMCKVGTNDLMAAHSKTLDTSKCRNVCTHPVLRRTRPCANKAGDKCCEVNADGSLTNCIKRSDAGDAIWSVGLQDLYKLNKDKLAKQKEATRPKPASTQSVASAAAPVDKPASAKQVRYNCYRYDVASDKIVKEMTVVGEGSKPWDSAYAKCNDPTTELGKRCKAMCLPSMGGPPNKANFKNPKPQKRLERHGCVYYQRAQIDGKWKCPPDYSFDTKMAEEGIGGLNRYQCTNHQTCVQHIQTENASGTDAVTLYNETDFRGKSATVTVADGLKNLRDTAIGNDSLTSLKIPKGLTVTLYQKENGVGNSLVLRGDEVDLGLWNFKNNQRNPNSKTECGSENMGLGGNIDCWNNSASSIRVQKDG